MGAEVVVEGLTKSFGKQTIWRDVTLTLPPGEVSAMLGPSGTGKSVFLKSIIGLLKPERGRCEINGVDIVTCSERKLYEIRKLFGVLFQDGALFGSMNLYDNVAFPLREHTKKSESEIRRIVLEKLDMTGLAGAEKKLPGEISGGMRKRAGLARALVLDPEIILVDEPDSGLDPVRTTYISQLLIDLNAQIDATILIVSHNINLARTVPDNIGMLFRRELVMFGPREVLLTSDEPAVKQFLNGSRIGPIGMSEEKDEATMAAEQAHVDAGHHDGGTEDVRGVVPQVTVTPGMPERAGVRRRKDRVMRILHTLPPAAQEGIIESLTPEERNRYGVHSHSAQLARAGGPAERTAPATTPLRPRPRPRPADHGSVGGDLAGGDVANLPDSNWQARRPGGPGSGGDQ
jgi:phospholipid/cholesterol/gamma-HCH transport system ATP-binding protein